MKRWLPLVIVVFWASVSPSTPLARPAPREELLIETPDLSARPSRPSGVLSLSSGSDYDTVYYGGTRWAPDSLRWEALRDSVWTFDTGVGSSINTGSNPNKPVGYHQTMEGWSGLDLTFSPLPYFRRSSTCVIAGSFSAWAGVTLSEANALCYAAGQGYGNSWNLYLGKTFTYPGSGNVTFSYKYAVECEGGFDYSYVIVDTTGADPSLGTGITLASYTGTLSGTDTFVLQRGLNMRSTPGPVTLWFNATSDGSYSDQDGLNPTACGHSAFDDVTLSGAITDVTNFETGMNGWAQFLPTTGEGDYSNLADRAILPNPATFCPCAVEDSVLVFFDLVGGHTWIHSGVIPANAEQVQVAWGVANYCHTAVIENCNSLSNSTPYFDNIRFGVFGPVNAPSVTLMNFDHLQDSFATDGTLLPNSTARLDAARIKNVTTPIAGARMSDTLAAAGDGGNTEVRLVFQIRPGPFTDLTALMTRAGRWTPEPGAVADAGALGGTWYTARLDTAEQAGVITAARWMATFHESDPGFLGNDRSPDPIDPSELENEILPDHILTPGSRVDYFIQSRYLPPDPRNTGGMTWFVHPDTTGRSYLEAEVLPSSMAADSTWNCMLYVDRHADREFDHQNVEEDGLRVALGTGGSNREGTRYDRFDSWLPTQISLGRPQNSNLGATLDQVSGYRSIAWHTGAGLAATLFFDADAAVLKPWLLEGGTTGRTFWASGDGFAQSVASLNTPAVLDFLNNMLGVTRTCNTIRDVNCPSGSVLDSTACLPLGSVAGSAFATTLPAGVTGNGCPTLRSFDLLGLYAGAPAAKGQLTYLKNGSPADFASVTNQIAGTGSKTVVDGFAIGDLRTGALCSSGQAARDRTLDVLEWFGSPFICRDPQSTSDVPLPGSGGPAYRASLSVARPNPTSGRTTIVFVNATGNDRVRIRIFDITGRLVRSLMDTPMPAGPHEVIWDGLTERGSPAAAGLYFYQLTAGDYSASKRLVVVK